MKRITRKPLYQCALDHTELQKAANVTLESIKGQDITGKQMYITLSGNITDLQDEFSRYRTITIWFNPDEVLPFLQLAATDNDEGYEALFKKYASSVRAFEIPQITIDFK